MGVKYIDGKNDIACNLLLELIEREKPLWAYQEPVDQRIHVGFKDNVFITTNKIQPASVCSFLYNVIKLYKNEMLVIQHEETNKAFNGFRLKFVILSFEYCNSELSKSNGFMSFVLPDVRAGDTNFRNIGIHVCPQLDRSHGTILMTVITFEELTEILEIYSEVRFKYLEALMSTVREEHDSIKEHQDEITISESQIDASVNNQYIKITESDLLLLNMMDSTIPFEKYIRKET